MKLWDTNILGELSRKRPNPTLLDWVETETAIAISAVTVDEIFFGLSWQPRPRILSWMERFLTEDCVVLDVTEDIACSAGKLRGKLRATGRIRSQADMWIAATARAHDLTLVTRNVKDFADCGIDLIDPLA